MNSEQEDELKPEPPKLEPEAPKERPKTLLDYTPEQWANFAERVGNQIVKYMESKRKEIRSLAYPVYFIIALIFGVIGFLAWQGLIDGQSVTFLAGIIIGYLLSYLGGYLTPE